MHPLYLDHADQMNRALVSCPLGNASPEHFYNEINREVGPYSVYCANLGDDIMGKDL